MDASDTKLVDNTRPLDTSVTKPLDKLSKDVFIPPPTAAFVAVAALPSKLACNVPTVTLKSPIRVLVAVVVPNINLSSLSSQPINTFSLLPRIINIPESFIGLPIMPLFKLIILSDISKFVAFNVVTAPFTVKLPATDTLPVKFAPDKFALLVARAFTELSNIKS